MMGTGDFGDDPSGHREEEGKKIRLTERVEEVVEQRESRRVKNRK